jgi:hypothetical protein
MGVESLVQNYSSDDLQIVTIKLPKGLVETMQGIRKATRRTNTEIYSELLKEGVSRFNRVFESVKTGKKRGRPKKNGNNTRPQDSR